MAEMLKSSGKGRRLNLALSARAVERLEHLQEATDSSNATQVIKDALLTYEALVKWLEEGYSFFVRDPKGALVPVDLLIDVEPRKPHLHAVEAEESPAGDNNNGTLVAASV